MKHRWQHQIDTDPEDNRAMWRLFSLGQKTWDDARKHVFWQNIQRGWLPERLTAVSVLTRGWLESVLHGRR